MRIPGVWPASVPEEHQVRANGDRPTGRRQELCKPRRPQPADERRHEPDERCAREKDSSADRQIDRERDPAGAETSVVGRQARGVRPLGTVEPSMHRALRTVVEARRLVAKAGSHLVSQARRLPDECRAHRGARGDFLDQPLHLWALDHTIGQGRGKLALDSADHEPFEAGARQDPLDEPASRLMLERSFDRRLDVGALEHLLGDSLDNLAIDERARDCLGQRTCQSVVDNLRGLGRSKHAIRRRLELITPAFAGGASLVSEASPITPQHRTDERRAGDNANRKKREPDYTGAGAGASHGDPNRDIARVRRTVHATSAAHRHRS